MNSRIDTIYNRFKSPDYRKQATRIILIANVPSAYLLNNLYFSIFTNFTYHWLNKYGKDYSRLKFIYLNDNDNPDDEKFSPLKKLNPGDQIDIIGHHYAGHDHIESDDNLRGATKKNTKYLYSYQLLSDIIIHNVNHDTLKLLEDETNQDRLPIKINLLACCTAVPKKNFFGSRILSKSIAEKMAEYFKSKKFTNIMVRGRLYDISPIPTTENNFIKFSIRYLMSDNRTELVPENECGFHIRNSTSYGWFSTFPRVIRNKPYKTDHFIMEDTNKQLVVTKVPRSKK